MKSPGAECIREFLRLKDLLGSNYYVPPVFGVVRKNEGYFSFVISGAHDIVVGSKGENGYPSITIKGNNSELILTADQKIDLRVGKDGNGKPIFLSLSNE